MNHLSLHFSSSYTESKHEPSNNVRIQARTKHDGVSSLNPSSNPSSNQAHRWNPSSSHLKWKMEHEPKINPLEPKVNPLEPKANPLKPKVNPDPDPNTNPHPNLGKSPYNSSSKIGNRSSMYQQLHKRTKQCLPKYKRRGWGAMRGEGGEEGCNERC